MSHKKTQTSEQAEPLVEEEQKKCQCDEKIGRAHV